MGMPTGDRDYSEQTAREIDEEVSRLIRDSYERTKKVLKEQLPALEQIVAVLFEKEVMDGDELRQILGTGKKGRERLSVDESVEPEEKRDPDDGAASSDNGSGMGGDDAPNSKTQEPDESPPSA